MGTTVAGEVCFAGASINGSLLMAGAQLGSDLYCHAEVKDRTVVGGIVSLLGASVKGQVSFIGADFRGEQDGISLHLDRAELGSLYCVSGDQHRTEFAGTVWMVGAKVTGQTAFLGANFKGSKDGVSLYMDDAELGALYYGACGKPCAAFTGKARMVSATVKSAYLYLDGVQDGSDGFPVWVDMERAVIDKLVIVGAGAPLGSMFSCAGMEFQHLDVKGLKGDQKLEQEGGSKLEAAYLWKAAKRLGRMPIQKAGLRLWLQDDAALGVRRFLALTEFDTGTYVQVERWLRSQGKDAIANDVYLARKREEMQPGRMNWWWRVWHRVLYWLVGYGVRTRWVDAILIFLFIVLTCTFSNPVSVQSSPNMSDTARAHSVSKDDHPLTWGAGDAAWIAMHTVVPMVSMVARDEWEPSTEISPLLWLRYDSLATLMSLLSWILIPLIIASATGLLKRQE
jgi:hypothetical protein